MHASNYHLTGRFTLSSPPHTPLCYLFSQVPTKDKLKHCEHWKDLADKSLTDSLENHETEGTQNSRRRNTERGTYNHAGTHNWCPYVSDIFNADVAHARGLKERKLSLLRLSNLYSYTVICDAIDICHFAFIKSIVSNRLHLIDYYGGPGARGNAIKD